jgi:hypothetical protein
MPISYDLAIKLLAKPAKQIPIWRSRMQNGQAGVRELGLLADLDFCLPGEGRRDTSSAIGGK